MLQVRSRLGCLGRSREDFAPVANEPSTRVTCKHLQGDGTTLSGIRYPHAVRHRISRNGEAAMAKEPKKLDELFHDTLKDIYFAEKKILSTLPPKGRLSFYREAHRPSDRFDRFRFIERCGDRQAYLGHPWL